MKNEKSGVRGQALVMVTLGLIAMCGMMGLAVDLGWSYFVEKQAQAAADAGALAAVQEASTRITSAVGFHCPAPSATTPNCQPAPVTCSTVTPTTNNLWNGCLYAATNSFADGGLGGRQKVTIQANDGFTPPPTAPGVTNIAYWVTVRATQTVPQLFSSIMGNTEGFVAASATAALVSSIRPGSFWALNQKGDCINNGGTGFRDFCGVDVDLSGSQMNSAPACASGQPSAALCAANGIVLSSTCHGANEIGCQPNNGSGNNWAGQTANGSSGAGVWASQAQVQPGGDVNNHGLWNPVPVAGSGAGMNDPFQGKPQPPLQVPGSGAALQGCAVPGGTLGTGNYGPYQYYATNNTGTPTGARITLSGNVQFSAGGGCPTAPVGGAISQPAFPAYLFYGGLEVGTSTTFGPGQYVMVGNNASANSGNAAEKTASFLLSGGNGTVTGDQTAGTQFIATDNQYPGLSTQFANVPAQLQPGGSVPLTQGNFQLKAGSSASVTLSGIDHNNVPSNLGDYNGSLFWQDRRNSTLVFDANGNVTSAPCNQALGGSSCSTVPNSLTANGVTDTSAGFVYDASVAMNLSGTLYQPRGAWFSFQGSANIASGLQIVTGMVLLQGSGQVSLLPDPRPIVRYIVALIK